MTTNPFVGPRPLRREDGIFGRDTEIRELQWYFTAERIVWFHAPSGAGKTSLLQAGLIPKLQKDNFVVLPTVRLNGPATPTGNRYIESMRASLGAPGTLRDFLAPQGNSACRVLLFDQFEELLSLHPGDTAGKEDFCRELGQLLALPHLWALFIVREDYLPAFNPYARFLPTGMNHRFRLELFSTANAATAMKQIAAKGGRTFLPEAAQTLAKELSYVPDPLTREEEDSGRVEPFYLQIICRRMWAGLPQGDTIQSGDVPTREKFRAALRAYYTECLQDFHSTRSQERDVRDWIGNTLIVNGVRNIVLESAIEATGITLDQALTLANTHIIRRESGSRPWFELAHDRLIEPVLEDNRHWEEANLLDIQKRATLWNRDGRRPSLLLTDSELAKAEIDCRDCQPTLRPYESEFLQLSRDASAVRRRVRRLNIAIRFLAVAMTAAALFATFSYLQATTRERIALSRLEPEPLANAKLAVQYALKALNYAEWLDAPLRRDAITALNEALQRFNPFLGAIYGSAFEKTPPIAILVTPGYVAVAFENCFDRFEANTIAHKHERWAPPSGITINKAALAPDAKSAWLALSNGDLCHVDIATATTINCRTGGAPAEALAVSANGVLAIVDNTSTLKRGEDVLSNNLRVNALAFSPDGQQLAAGLDEGKVHIYKTGLATPAVLETGHDKPITALAWGAGGLVAGSLETSVIRLWDAKGRHLRDQSHAGGVIAIAMSPDGAHVATIGPTGAKEVNVWPTAGGPSILLSPHPSKAKPLESIAFHDNEHLLAVDKENNVRRYALTPNALRQAADRALPQP